MDRGRIGVIDPVLRRLTVLSEQLDFLTAVDMPTFHEASSAHVLLDGSWVSLFPGAGDRADSSQLRYSSANASTVGIVATVHTPPSQFIAFGDVGFNLVPEYQARDIWGLHRSGELWVARGGSNRVDLVRSDGRVTIGSPVPFPEIRTTSLDLARWRGQPAPDILREAGVKRPMSRTKAPFQGVASSPSGDLWFWLNQRHGYQTELYSCRTKAGRVGASAQVPYGSKLLHVGHRRWYFYFLSEEGVGELRAYHRPSCV
jgi:hypothetical protein